MYHVTLPALLFVNIISEVTVARLMVLWKLPVLALVHVCSGFILATCLTTFFRIRGIGKKAVTLCLMFGNVGSLSIAMIDTLCADEPLASGVGPDCDLRGVEYISFYLITQTILMFTWAEEIVKDQKGDEEEEEEEALEGEDEVMKSTYFQDTDQERALECRPHSASMNVPGAAARLEREGSDQQVPPALASGPSSALSRRRGSVATPSRTDNYDSGIRTSASELGPGTPRLRRLQSHSQILDQEDINSILSRYPVESRPQMETEQSGLGLLGSSLSLVGSMSSPYLPSLSSSPSLFRLRGSRTDTTHPQLHPEESGERERLMGRRRSGSTGFGSTHQAGNSSVSAGKGNGAVPSEGLVPPRIAVKGLEPSRSHISSQSLSSTPPLPMHSPEPSILVVRPPTCYSRILDVWVGFLLVISRLAANPSIRAALTAFFLGLFPPIKALFVPTVDRPDPPLGAFLGAMRILGQAQVPCSMLMLSGSGTIRYLNDKAAQNNATASFAFKPRVIFCIILGRILLFPLIGLGAWWGGYTLGLFEGTPVLSLVALLDAAVPSAQNVVMLILVHGKSEHGHALAYVILWQYALCIPVLILNVTIYLSIIRSVYLDRKSVV